MTMEKEQVINAVNKRYSKRQQLRDGKEELFQMFDKKCLHPLTTQLSFGSNNDHMINVYLKIVIQHGCLI